MKFDELKERFDKLQNPSVEAQQAEDDDMSDADIESRDNRYMIKHIMEYLEAKEKPETKTVYIGRAPAAKPLMADLKPSVLMNEPGYNLSGGLTGGERCSYKAYLVNCQPDLENIKTGDFLDVYADSLLTLKRNVTHKDGKHVPLIVEVISRKEGWIILTSTTGVRLDQGLLDNESLLHPTLDNHIGMQVRKEKP